ncbi:MAG: hypothetical protein JNM82_17255 [Rhodocyclaceae bacterium]|nr:hypothetical protein [Rhodocyclaceae bacterium]
MKSDRGFVLGLGLSTLFRIAFPAMTSHLGEVPVGIIPIVFWYFPIVVVATWELLIEINRRRKDGDAVARLEGIRKRHGPFLLGIVVGTAWFIVFPVKQV